MNFDIKVVPSLIPSRIVNDTPIGILGAVANGEADVGGGALTIALDREKYIEYSPFINTNLDVIITDLPEKGLKMFSFIQAFPLNIWLPLLSTIPVTASILYIIYHVLKEFNEAGHYYETSYIWEVTKILLWDSTKVGFDDYISTKINVGIYMLATSLLINIYFGEYTSFITARPFKHPPIDSLNQLENSELKWLLRQSNPIQGYFKNNRKIVVLLP